MRLIKQKAVQVHWHCTCGCNVVETQYLRFTWADFAAAKIKRLKDKKTGKYFLAMSMVAEECHCNEE